MPNYSDPNLDFALQDQLLKSQLLRGRALQDQKLEAYQGNNQHVARYMPGATIANILNNWTGGRQADRATEGLSQLSSEQNRRIDALNQELNTPQNVNWTDSQAAQAENARRSGVVSQLQRLPMAAESANKIAERLQQFPEVMMKQQDATAARMEQQRLRDEAAAERNREKINSANERATERNALMMTLKAMGLNQQVGAAQTKADIKRAAAFTDEKKGYQTTMNNLTDGMAVLQEFIKGGGADAVKGSISGKLANTVGTIPFAGDYSKGVSQLEDLKAKMMAMGRELQNATGKIGPMATQEWPIMMRTISNLDPSAPDDFMRRLRAVDLKIRGMAEVLQESYAAEAAAVGQEDTIIDFDALTAKKMDFMNQDEAPKTNVVPQPEPTTQPVEKEAVMVNDADAWEALSPGTKWKTPDGRSGVK